MRAGEISDHRSLNLLLNGTFAVVILLVFGLSIHALLTTFGPSPTENSSQRVIRYRDIGAMLSKECSDCTLLTSEIGGLGFSFSGTVYDAFGLGDNQAVRFHPMKVPEERSTYYVGAIPVGYVEFRDPDLIVSMPVFSEAFRKSSLPSRYFKYECPISADRRTQIFGDTIIEIFSKRELSANGLAAAKCFF